MVLLVRGRVLPEREERSLWIDGGVLREDPVAGADTVADGGWLVPGLVDVHTHPGAEKPGDPFDESVLRRHLADHAAAGVLLIRAPGAAARIPGWAHDAEGLPWEAAVGAASWAARAWLGLPGLTDGAPADLVVFDEDPVAHPDILHHPRLVILRGQILA